MLKHVATVNFMLAGVFVLPGFVGAPSLAGPQDATRGIAQQLDATVAAIDYLGELARLIESRDVSAIPMLIAATEQPRQTDVQRESRLVGLRSEVSRLRLALDRLLDRSPGDLRVPGAGDPLANDPGAAAMNRTSREHVPTTTSPWAGGVSTPTTGLGAGASGALSGILPPLQNVTPAARMRGGDTLALEQEDFTADAVRHGKLLYRAGRHAEAIQLLRAHERDFEARYWLAQSYRAVDRTAEAVELLRTLVDTEGAAPYDRYAKSDLQFIEWKRQLDARRSAREALTGGARR